MVYSHVVKLVMLQMREARRRAAEGREVQPSAQVHRTLLPLRRPGVSAGLTLHGDRGDLDTGEVELKFVSKVTIVIALYFVISRLFAECVWSGVTVLSVVFSTKQL